MGSYNEHRRRINEISSQMQRNLNSRLDGCRFREADGDDFDAETLAGGHDEKQITFVHRPNDVIELYKGDTKIGSSGGGGGGAGNAAIMYSNNPSGWDYRASSTSHYEQTTYGTTRVNEINTVIPSTPPEDIFTMIPFVAVNLDDYGSGGWKQIRPQWINSMWFKNFNGTTRVINADSVNPNAMKSYNKCAYDTIGVLSQELNPPFLDIFYNEFSIFTGAINFDVLSGYEDSCPCRAYYAPWLRHKKYKLQNGMNPGPVSLVFDRVTQISFDPRTIRKHVWNNASDGSKFNSLNYSIASNDPNIETSGEDSCKDFGGCGLAIMFQDDGIIANQRDAGASPSLRTIHPILCFIRQDYYIVWDDASQGLWHTVSGNVYVQPLRDLVLDYNFMQYSLDGNINYIYDTLYWGRVNSNAP